MLENLRRLLAAATAPGLALALLLGGPASAQRGERVDLELVHAVDVSGSMDQEEQEVQRQGYIDAFRHGAIANAVRSGSFGRIAVTYVEWAGTPRQAVPWMTIANSADAQAFNEVTYDGPALGLEGATKAVAKVQAGNVGPDSDRTDKMLVRFNYVGMWDIWYRFRFFALAAYDHQSQELLFVTGQGRDNLVSNEEVVIRDTMEQFRKAVTSR